MAILLGILLVSCLVALTLVFEAWFYADEQL